VALKKLSITKEEKEMLIELAGRGLSSYKIAKKLKMKQSTVWRNMEHLGINNHRKHKIDYDKKKVFDWRTFNNCMI
jgi:DNA-binding CsgD family transcriptional regulator